MERPKANLVAASARAVHLGPLAVASAATSLQVNAPPVLAKVQSARASVPLALDRHASDRAVPAGPRVTASGRPAALAEAEQEAPGPTGPSASRKGIAQPVAQAASSADQPEEHVPVDQDGPVARHVPVLSAVRHVATANHAHPSAKDNRAHQATGPSSGRIPRQAIVPKDARPADRYPAPIVRSADSRRVHALKALLHGQKAPVRAQRAVTAEHGPSGRAASVLADSASRVAVPNHSASPASASRPIASLQAIALLRMKQPQSVPAPRGLHLVRRGPHLVPAHGPAPAHANPSANRVPGVQLPEDRAPQARARVAPLQPQVPASRAVPVALANPAHLVNRALPVARPPREASVTSSHAASPRLPNVRPRNVPVASQLPNANRAAKETKAS